MEKHLIIQLTPQELSEIIQSSVEAVLNRFKEEFQPDRQDELMSRKDASEFLGISLTTLYHWMKAGRVKYYKVGSKIYLLRNDLIQLFEQEK